MKPDTNDKKIVTRFAPSPTGFMHVGGVRTALYAWAFAKKHGGKFILRIEDTDKEREVDGSIEHIMESLKWLGLSWSEGPDIGGPNAPYIQSQRLDTYKKYADILVEKGLAYADPYTQEQLESFRKQAEEEKRPFLYRNHRPENPPTWDGSMPLRLKISEPKTYKWNDAVRGELEAGPEALDDFILVKSDGYPTYNFAHIIDDLYMGVTHIFRADEFISSTPKFLALYEALDITPPVFVTLPPIMSPDGKKKLGKRDGAKDILEYKKEGFLVDAMINFLAFIGWNPGDDREIFDSNEFLEAFDLKGIQRSGGKLNEEKLLWFNKEHLKKMSDSDFKIAVDSFITEDLKKLSTYDERIDKVLPLIKERISVFKDVAEMISSQELHYFFMQTEYNVQELICPEKLRKGIEVGLNDVKDTLRALGDLLTASTEKQAALAQGEYKNIFWDYADQRGRGIVLWALRVALSGREKSADPFTICSVIGTNDALQRIENAIQKISNQQST